MNIYHCHTTEPHMHCFVGLSIIFHWHIERNRTHGNILHHWSLDTSQLQGCAAELLGSPGQATDLHIWRWQMEIGYIKLTSDDIFFLIIALNSVCFLSSGIDLRALERALKKKAKEAADAEEWSTSFLWHQGLPINVPGAMCFFTHGFRLEVMSDFGFWMCRSNQGHDELMAWGKLLYSACHCMGFYHPSLVPHYRKQMRM